MVLTRRGPAAERLRGYPAEELLGTPRPGDILAPGEAPRLIAELQRLSGARVAASPWTAEVMKAGAVPRDDPQFGTIRPIARLPPFGSCRMARRNSAPTP